ncbi:MAG: CsbD family protein [Chloroflexales bacterium]
MAKNNSRVHGRNQALAGKVKQGVGKLIGDEQLEAAGASEVIQGEANEAAAQAAERTIGAVEELRGTIKSTVGNLIASPALTSEGQTEIKRGKRRQSANQ